MTVHIALVRGIHAGGRDRVAALELGSLLDGPDCAGARSLLHAGARSLLQTGNLVFSCRGRTAAELEHLLDIRAGRRLGVHAGFLIRTADDWADVIARNPFRAEAERDPGHLLVMLLKDVPNRAAVDSLQAGVTGPEAVRVDGRQVYVTYPAGIGRSRLTGTLIETTLGTRGTARSWKTVLKLAALARQAGR